MDWIKRNLYFVIFMSLALILMGASGWYLYSSWSLNASKYTEFSEIYSTLKDLNDQNPNPGEEGPGKVDNVAAAKEQEIELRKVMGRTVVYYQSIKRIPDLPKVTDHDFSTALSLTIAQMLHSASNANVSLATEGYGFSFDPERQKMVFTQSGLYPLSVQLGEVKAITDVLFNAKVNSLDGLRRERVSPDDSGSDTDYLEQKSITNNSPLAVLTPYEVTFRGFSQELASVLSGFASSPFGFVVKSINVEPSPATEEAPPPTANVPTPAPVANYIPPPRPTPPPADPYVARYGPRPPQRPIPQPLPQAPVVAPAPKSGPLQTVLTEKKLKVTLLLEVVKPVAPAKAAPK